MRKVSGVITRELDDQDHIITVRGSGIWTSAEVGDHYRALQAMLAALRIAGKPIRVLSDVTLAERQRREIETYILHLMTQTYLPGDRIAVLTADSVDQVHVRGLLVGVEVAVFRSRLAAEMWLMMDTPRPGA